MTKQEFISYYGPAAQRACAGTSLFPSVALGQGIQESGWGASKLASQYNNFFGIKSFGGWTGKTVTLKNGAGDPNAYSTYRVYDTAEEGFADRCKFLQQNSRYAKAGVFDAKTPMEQLQRIKAAGYAEDPNYVSKIMNIINQNNLTQFDVALPPVQPIVVAAQPKKSNFIVPIIVGISFTALFIGGVILIKNSNS